MLDQDRPTPFFSICFYVVVDTAFWVFVTLYLVGDVYHQDNFLKYLRAVPAWLLIIELFTLRVTHRGMWTVFLAFLFYSIGDWLLLFRQKQDPYAVGLFGYMIGHGLVITSIVLFIRDSTKRQGGVQKTIGSYSAFTAILIVVLGLMIISIIGMAVNVPDQFGGYVVPIVIIFGLTIVGVTMTGFFYFFACYKISTQLYWGSLQCLFGTILLFIGNNFLIHGKYNEFYIERVSQAANVYLEMFAYYGGLYFLGKGFFNTARYFSLLDSNEVGPNHGRRRKDLRSGSDSKVSEGEVNPAGESIKDKRDESNPERGERFGSNVRLQP